MGGESARTKKKTCSRWAGVEPTTSAPRVCYLCESSSSVEEPPMAADIGDARYRNAAVRRRVTNSPTSVYMYLWTRCDSAAEVLACTRSLKESTASKIYRQAHGWSTIDLLYVSSFSPNTCVINMRKDIKATGYKFKKKLDKINASYIQQGGSSDSISANHGYQAHSHLRL